MEIWKDIENYEGVYQVSDLGVVKSLARTIIYTDGRSRKVEERILKQNNDKDGYKVVCLAKNKSKAMNRVHRLVAKAFIPNEDNKPQVNHLNENKHDNRVYNLEWCTSKENINYGTGIEKRADKGRKRIMGTHINNGNRIIYKSITESEKDGFNSRIITEACRNQRNQHFGYKWEYIDEKTYKAISNDYNHEKPTKMYDENNVEGTKISSIMPKAVMKNNTSGIVGVRYIEESKTWLAYLNFKGKAVLNKRYKTKKEAIEARKKAEKEYFEPFLKAHLNN